MSKKAVNHSISGVFVFMLLGIFAVFSTVMVLLGARAYKSTAERAAQHNEARIATAYMRSMVRASDWENAVVIEDVNGVRTVTLRSEYDGEEYVTRLYAFDGMLREWFTSADAEFDPELGEAICAADELDADLTDHLLRVRLRSGEEWSDVDIALRSAVE